MPTPSTTVSAQAHAGGFAERFDRLGNWPLEARTLYFLVTAHAILGGKGFEVYLEQAPFEEVLGILHALEEGGCERLACRMRQGFTVCGEDGSAELLAVVDDDWVEREGLPVPEGDERAWSRIDSHEEGGTWWLVEHELAPALERYLAQHRAAIAR